MKILITGSSGMIGSELVNQLDGGKNEVWCIDKVPPRFSNPRNFIRSELRYQLYDSSLPQKIDVIIHLAANSRVGESIEDPLTSVDNVMSTVNVLEFAKRLKNKPLVLIASSREVYSDVDNPQWVDETMGSQRSAKSPYSASKISNEAFAWSYIKCFDMNIRIMRLSNVYGKYDFSNRLIPNLITKFNKNEQVVVNGKDSFLDLIYISDVIDGIKLLIKTFVNKRDGDIEYNIASGYSHHLTEVAEYLKQRLGSKSKISIGKPQKGETTMFTGNIGRMKSLGWRQPMSLEEGLEKTINYYLSQ